MIRQTVKTVGDQIERLARKKIPVAESLEILCKTASTSEELVVIEVMREVYQEMIRTERSRERKAS